MTIEDYNLNERCSGCFSCYNVCPVQAIELPLNKEGFYHPVIDKNKCINCGMCSKVCAASGNLSVMRNTIDNKMCFSFQADDQIRSHSSSGGVFYKLATYTINRGGVVFGARFNSDTKEVEHSSTEDVPLDQLLRSKYVQSKIGNTYSDVKKFLQANKMVLFVGTPCQVYGLKAFLGKPYANLYTMDFVCHGVPSTGYFKDWLIHLEKENGHKIEDVTFREKDDGWRCQIIKIYFDNSTQKVVKSNYYYYYRYFLSNLTLRKSCYHCNFPANRYSDFTVKDYWEGKDDDNKGVSAIVINSEKGQEFLNDVIGDCLKVISFDEIQHGFIPHSKIKNYTRYEKLREFYFDKYVRFGFDQTVSRYNRMIDLILTCIGKCSVFGGELKSTLMNIIRRK